MREDGERERKKRKKGKNSPKLSCEVEGQYIKRLYCQKIKFQVRVIVQSFITGIIMAS